VLVCESPGWRNACPWAVAFHTSRALADASRPHVFTMSPSDSGLVAYEK
jgi:hypothetical protein